MRILIIGFLRTALICTFLGILLGSCVNRQTKGQATLAAETAKLDPDTISEAFCSSPVTYPVDTKKTVNADRPLLQVLFVGLMVFEDCQNTRPCGRNAKGLYVYLPKTKKSTGHTDHEVIIAAGAANDFPPSDDSGEPENQWIVLTKGNDLPNASVLTLDTSPLDIQGKKLLRTQWALNHDLRPGTSQGSRDSKWLIRAQRVAKRRQTWDYDAAQLTFLFDTGCFETCSLTADNQGRACQVKLGRVSAPVASETMLLRQPLPQSTQVVKIGGVTIPVHAGESIKVGKYKYNKVYNVAIVNLPPDRPRVPGPRPSRSTHSRLLAKMFRKPNPGPWREIRSSACANRAIQPACFDYFRERFNNVVQIPKSKKTITIMSGFNRPICPLIEGP